MRSALVTLTVLLAAAAGCGGSGQVGGSSEPAVAAPPVSEEKIVCANEEAGYRVEYPANWHTNGELAPPCSYFHHTPFEVPDPTESHNLAVTVTREPVDLATLAAGDPSRRVLAKEQEKIGENSVARLDVESTGVGLLPPSLRYYQAAVALDGESIILSTHAVPDLDFETNKQVVDAMLESLELTN